MVPEWSRDPQIAPEVDARLVQDSSSWSKIGAKQLLQSQEDAENALDGRQKYLDAMGDLVHDVFYHEGDMDFAFLNTEILKHEMVESL